MSYRQGEHERYAGHFTGKYTRFRVDLLDFVIDLDAYLSYLYNFTTPLPELKFTAHGCIGYGSMDAHALSVGRTISGIPGIMFNLLLGDIIYPCGANTPEDLRNFYDAVYPAPTDPARSMPASERVPISLFTFTPFRQCLLSFACPGNHDYDYHGHHRPATGPDRILHEIDYTYRERLATYSGFQMPYRYYALHSSFADFFMLDSITLPWDERQQEWLRVTYQNLTQRPSTHPQMPRRLTIFAMHTPLLTYGRRLINHDCDLYGSAYANGTTLLPALQTNRRPPLSDLNNAFFRANNMEFDLLFNAHDHYMDRVILENGATQITASPSWHERGGVFGFHKHIDTRHAPENAGIKRVYGNDDRFPYAFDQKSNALSVPTSTINLQGELRMDFIKPNGQSVEFVGPGNERDPTVTRLVINANTKEESRRHIDLFRNLVELLFDDKFWESETASRKIPGGIAEMRQAAETHIVGTPANRRAVRPPGEQNIPAFLDELLRIREERLRKSDGKFSQLLTRAITWAPGNPSLVLPFKRSLMVQAFYFYLSKIVRRITRDPRYARAEPHPRDPMRAYEEEIAHVCADEEIRRTSSVLDPALKEDDLDDT